MNLKLLRAPGRALPALAFTTLALALAGCQVAPPDSGTTTGTLLGRIDAPAGAQTVVVAKDERGQVVHRAFLADGRRYEMAVPAGRVSVFAFVDENQDGWLGASEPASARYVLAAPVGSHDRIELPRLQVRASRARMAAN